MQQVQDIEAMSAVYSLLGRVFIEKVDTEILRWLRADGFRQPLIESGIDIGDEFFSQNEDELLENLAVEYARLFIVNGGCVPAYESVYLEDRLMGETAQAVKEFYRQCELGVIEESLMSDHIGLELELLGRLKYNEAEAVKANDPDASKWGELSRQFITEHLSRWALQFFANVEQAAEHQFYRVMANVGQQLLQVSIYDCGLQVEGEGE